MLNRFPVDAKPVISKLRLKAREKGVFFGLRAVPATQKTLFFLLGGLMSFKK